MDLPLALPLERYHRIATLSIYLPLRSTCGPSLTSSSPSVLSPPLYFQHHLCTGTAAYLPPQFLKWLFGARVSFLPLLLQCLSFYTV